MCQTCIFFFAKQHWEWMSTLPPSPWLPHTGTSSLKQAGWARGATCSPLASPRRRAVRHFPGRASSWGTLWSLLLVQSQPENIPGSLLLYKEFPQLQALLLLYTVGGHYREPGATGGTQEEALVLVKRRMKPLCSKMPKDVVSNLSGAMLLLGARGWGALQDPQLCRCSWGYSSHSLIFLFCLTGERAQVYQRNVTDKQSMLCSTSIVIIKQKPQQVLTCDERCG